MDDITFEPGELIDHRYRVQSVLGVGGIGTVYRVADDGRGGRVVALKTVAADTSLPGAVEGFRREFGVLARLRHPNLVSVYDYGVADPGVLYFTMEYMDGPNLRSHSEGFRPEAIVPLIVEICRALAYLHARGVVHGDLKPSNVLVVEDQIKLLDFGLAFEPHDDVVWPSGVGTRGYIAPELRLSRPVDWRADLYSLGALWYELLVGAPPLLAPSYDQQVGLALVEALGPEDEDGRVASIVLRLLSASPQDRYVSANAVIAALNETLSSSYALETRETAASYALQGRFVGRERERASLLDAWRRARAADAEIVLIGGERGVGKTRLAEEFGIQAALDGARLVVGHCVESGGGSYQPWREILRVLVRHVEGSDPAEMARLGPALAALMPELWERPYMEGAGPPHELDPRAAQLRLNETIVDTLRAAAASRPTILVLEDFHWADEASVDLLSYLARAGELKGLLTCVTFRDEELEESHPLRALANERVSRLYLPTLAPAATADLVQSMLGLRELPPAIAERVQSITGGNTYFVQELVRSLADEDAVLQRTATGWRVDETAVAAAALPSSIREAILRRLEHLPRLHRQVLQHAALIGPVFWDGAVSRVQGLTGEGLRDVLRSLCERGLVLARDRSQIPGVREYAFQQAVLRDVTYESIHDRRRRAGHAQVADWLVEQGAEREDEWSGLIAGQLEASGNTERAAVYYRRAGERAAAQFANAQAVLYLGRALELVPETDMAERCAVLLARERVYDLQGAQEMQVEDLARAAALAADLGDIHRRAEVAVRQAYLTARSGDHEAAVAMARSAIDLARLAGDPGIESDAHMQWAVSLWMHGEYEAARSRLEQGLALARAGQVRRAEGDALNVLGIVSVEQGRSEDAVAFFEQAASIRQQIDDRVGHCAVLNNLAHIFLYRGEYTRAKESMERSLAISREIGSRVGECIVLANLGLLFDALGQYAKAESHLEQALRISREIDNRVWESWQLAYLGLLHHHIGDDTTSAELGERALEIARELWDRLAESLASAFLGHALCALGRLDEAAGAYERAVQLRRELGQERLAVEGLAGLARVALTRGTLDEAQVHVEEILGLIQDGCPAGLDEPLRVYLTCYRVLSAVQDPRAPDVLGVARGLLRARSATIADEELRRSFLEGVAVHREVMQ